MTERTAGIGQAGTLESCDARVTVELLAEAGVTVEVEGPMKAVFGDAVRAVAEEELARGEVSGARVRIVDRGALDYVIRARVRCALARALDEGTATP